MVESQVEVTSEMIAAGSLSLNAWLDVAGFGVGQTLAEQALIEVFLSMAKHSPQIGLSEGR